MRCLVISVAVIVGVVWGGLVPAMATPLTVLGVKSHNVQATLVEKVGWRRQYRRYYRRYGYPVPYAYYPPAYGYAPPPAYAHYPSTYGYYPPANGDYGDYPPANGDYPSANGDSGDYPPANGDYGDYPQANGY
jgi:hypothetical protein